MSTNTTTTSTTPNQVPDRGRAESRPVVRPLVEIIDSQDETILIAEMPGVNQESAEVTLEQNVLTIKGRSRVDVPEGFKRVYGEWSPADYERTFTVGDDIDPDKIEAVVRNGVLTLTMPKKSKTQSHKIQIKAG